MKKNLWTRMLALVLGVLAGTSSMALAGADDVGIMTLKSSQTTLSSGADDSGLM